jgi:ABC-type lipoprotein release transport system permease subunit
MNGVLLVAWSVVRRHWRNLVVVIMLVGVAGAVVLAATAGARRTSSSLDRFRTYSRSADLELDLDAATPEQLAELRRLPEVAAIGVLRQVMLARPGGGYLPAAAAVDRSFGTAVDRPRVIQGRLADPANAHELAISEHLATDLGLRVGDAVTFASYSVEQIEAIASGGAVTAPQGPDIRFDIVGLVRRPLDLAVSGGFGGVVVPTPAFNARYRDEIGGFVNVLLRVRARHGAAGVPEIVRAARGIFGDSLFQVLGVATETEGAENAIDVLTVALWIFAAVAAVAGATAVGIVTVRQIGDRERDQELLAALGLTVRQRAAAAGCLALPAAVAGGVLAAVVAASLSSIFPFGVAGQAEVDPGFRVDAVALGFGVLGIIAFVLVVAAAASWRVAHSLRRDRESRALRRPSAAARAAANAGASPVVTTGVRMALEPGRGSSAVPVRSAVVGAALGTLGITAVLVFGSSLNRLVTTPSRYGRSWDIAIVPDENANAASEPAPTFAEIVRAARENPALGAIAAVAQEAVEVDGRPLTGSVFRSVRGSIAPTIVVGRAPGRVDEVALGAAALDAIDKGVGDSVEVRSDSRTRRFRVAGQVVLPSLSDEPEALANGAVFSRGGFVRLFPSVTVPNVNLVARFADDVNPQALPRTPSGGWRFDASSGLRQDVPVEVDRLVQVDRFPAVLGLLLGLLASVAVAHAIALAIRRRRREFAVLRTIGFRRGEVRAAIAVQSTTLALLGVMLGVPAGIAVGRIVWRAVAEGVGVAPGADVPVVLLFIVVAGALLVTNLIGVVAATAAVHDRPAPVLATE